jgi:hypothetical protein
VVLNTIKQTTNKQTYCIIFYDMTYAYHSQTFQFHMAIVLPNISVKGYV